MSTGPLAGRTRRGSRLAAVAGAAGVVGLSTAGAAALGLDALVRVRPRVAGPSAVVLGVEASTASGYELAVTLRGAAADQAGFAGIFGGRGRLLAGPPQRVDDGWLRHTRSLPGAPSALLEPGHDVVVTADPWVDCDDPLLLGATTTQLPGDLGPLTVTTLDPAGEARRAVVYLHGRSGHRQTGWWFAPTVADAGWRVVLPSYRNDADGPRTGRYLLGGEWVDLIHVLDDLARDGIEEVALIGWSMGGNIAASYLRERQRDPARFAHHPRPVGLVLDAAALDWGPVMRHAARRRRLPDAFVPAVMTYGQLAGRIDWRILNHLSDLSHLELPVLAFHGSADDTVPAELSEQLAAGSPHVRYERFEGAGHCRSVNVDPGRYLGALRGFLDRL